MLRLSAPTCFSRLPFTAPSRQPFQVHCVRLRLIALVIPKRHSALGQDFPHPTNSTAAIIVSRRCFISLQFSLECFRIRDIHICHHHSQLESGLGDDIQPAASLGNLKNSTCPSPKRILLRYWPLTVCQRYLGSSLVRFGCHVQSP